MNLKHLSQLAIAVSAGLGLTSMLGLSQDEPFAKPTYGRLPRSGKGIGSRSKISTDLKYLVSRWRAVKGSSGGPSVTAEALGVSIDPDVPQLRVAVEVRPGTSTEALRTLGLDVSTRAGNLVYGYVTPAAVDALDTSKSVVSVSLPKGATIPLPPSSRARITKAPAAGPAMDPLMRFDRKGLTGKGVIVAIIDTGIDWRHPDFIKPDGTTRILYLYDMNDPSSASGTGRPGPVKKAGKPMGTVYSATEINAALQGSGKVNSRDVVGHGTACAGIAAGNGRAAAPEGAPAEYTGVAPGADLIVVRADSPAGGIRDEYDEALKWVADTAKSLNRPCVVNLSFGGHVSSHRGDEASEKLIDTLTGKGKPGLVVCVAAGNERTLGIHARSRFGARRKAQGDIGGSPAEVFVRDDATKQGTPLVAYFDAGDEWGLAITGDAPPFAQPEGPPAILHIFRDGDAYGVEVERKGERRPATGAFEDIAQGFAEGNANVVYALLRKGRYTVQPYGNGPEVKSGVCDLYLPAPGAASFGIGVDERYIVGSPGNARNAITVGAYHGRTAWTSQGGETTWLNLPLGEAAPFTSVGFRRDNLVKPDLVAPGSYMVSPLAAGSQMGKSAGELFIGLKGKYLAWEGTSAASPYTVGFIALMLEKNPKLDAAAIRTILARTAAHDQTTGAVPNELYGNGRLNPAKALAELFKAR